MFSILNMSSASATDDRTGDATGDVTDDTDPTPTGGPTAEVDLTARARIRDAALRCFADRGVKATTVRTIAEEAGVSPALVIHHFGSKQRLRVACDEHVAATIRTRKREVMQAGTGLDPIAAFRAQGEGPPLIAYLARTLTDGSPHVAELIDEMVADAVEYMAEGEATGMLQPSEDPHGRAAVLVLWSLGAVVLHEQAQRLLGVDLLGDLSDARAYLAPAFELLGRGVLTEQAYAQLKAGIDGLAAEEEAS
ncbi:MAG: TetR/AcrR family transcriptional regulator [Nitriliruptoraceae bacterium]